MSHGWSICNDIKPETDMEKSLFAVDPATGEIPDGAAAQAERAFANVRAILVAAGLGPEHVVKTTVFLADLADFAAVNAVYARTFSEPFPARSCVQVTALPRGARLEVEAIAVRR